MSCHGCASKFGFWNKENGCPSCGFSFCNSCLKNKCAVPKLDNKVSKVCKECHNSIVSGDSKSDKEMPQYTPPDVFLKRLEALEAPPKPPVTIYRTEPRMQNLMKGLNSTDLEIVRRLDKLREDRRAAKNVPTEDELAHRLAALKGQRENQTPSKQSYADLAPDSRSGEEQTRDLFAQCKEEVKLDKKIKRPEDDIAERLNRLRNKNDIPNEESAAAENKAKEITLDEIAQLLAQCQMEAGKSGKHVDLATIASLEKLRTHLVQQNDKMDEGSSDEDEAKATAKILAKVQAEVDLEKSLGIVSSAKEEEDEIMDAHSDAEELPWCIICNEDAKLRCQGCDGDLFCKSCFQEGHNDEEMRAHSFEPYSKK